MPVETESCPLCYNNGAESFFADKVRSYLRCQQCRLVFVPHQYWLSATEEKASYDLHENDVNDPGYRKFLSRLVVPLQEKLPTSQRGLDFGCGPGPALAELFREYGHQVDLFDCFYHNDKTVFSNSYDFICATEVIEHLRSPAEEFTRLFSVLKSGGWLGIMTKQVSDRDAFSRWHYIRDLTHICFYSPATFEYLAARFDANFELLGDDVILFRKSLNKNPDN